MDSPAFPIEWIKGRFSRKIHLILRNILCIIASDKGLFIRIQREEEIIYEHGEKTFWK